MKHLTVKELIEQLTELSKQVGEDTFVYADDSSGYEYEVYDVYIDDYNHILIGQKP